jgi:hypothetical protein
MVGMSVPRLSIEFRGALVPVGTVFEDGVELIEEESSRWIRLEHRKGNERRTAFLSFTVTV